MWLTSSVLKVKTDTLEVVILVFYAVLVFQAVSVISLYFVSNIGCIMLFLVWSRGLLLWCTPGAPHHVSQIGGVWSLGR